MDSIYLYCIFIIVQHIVVQSLNRVRLFGTPWTVAHQAPLSMRFSRQEYWSGLPCPPPGDLPNPVIDPESPVLAGGFFTAEPPGKPHLTHRKSQSKVHYGIHQWNCKPITRSIRMLGSHEFGGFREDSTCQYPFYYLFLNFYQESCKFPHFRGCEGLFP